MDGYYYLHTNGSIIYKRFNPSADDSDFVRRVWPIDGSSRECAWKIVLESLALGASLERVKELAGHWGCDIRDLVNAMCRMEPSNEMRDGAKLFLEKVVGVDPDAFYDWLAATPKGSEPDWATAPADCRSLERHDVRISAARLDQRP